MKITVIGFLFAVVACIAIYRTIFNLKNEIIGYRSGMIWLGIWGGIAFFGIFPGTLNIVMELVRMNSRIFFVLILAVFILYALAFNQASHIDNLNRKLRKLTREIAILNYRLDNEHQGDSETKKQ